MVTIIIMIKLFHLFISALCAAVCFDSVNLTETFPVCPSLCTASSHTIFSIETRKMFRKLTHYKQIVYKKLSQRMYISYMGVLHIALDYLSIS